jgi:predicted transposase/invertase (TIGR01784 family)
MENNNSYTLTPRNDYLFKRLFGDEKDKDILVEFLKTILDVPEDDYEKIDILNPISNADYEGDKINIVDVKVRTKSGQIVNVEIQRYRESALRSRMVYQECKLLEEQLGSGDGYEKLHKAVCIIITEFTFIHENAVYHNKYELYNRVTKSTLSDILLIHTFELDKLPEFDDGEPFWDWMKFISSDEVDDMEAIAEKNEGVRKAVVKFKEITADERERIIAEAAEKQRRIQHGIQDYARQEGLAEGQEKGRAEGRIEEARTFACRMKADNIEPAFIAKYTGLSEKEIEML